EICRSIIVFGKQNRPKCRFGEVLVILAYIAVFSYGLNIEQSIQNEYKSVKNSVKAVPAGHIGVTFADIEVVEDVKETSKELVMLPPQRTCEKAVATEAGAKFINICVGSIASKPCKGIRRAPPPRTSKTLLAKAVATEAGAKFINICVGSIASEGGEIPMEQEAMRKIKNECMVNLVGLRTPDKERVLFLAATNRPCDPASPKNNGQLATCSKWGKKVILAKEELAAISDLEAGSSTTEWYSGSDLK
ncbi:UNVERIFIED_CONTAM: hypothetical protein Slati_2269400, partial [Sesamum latifolium]